MDLQEGALVSHVKFPEWGPGKVVRASGRKVYVVFRDVPDKDAKVFDSRVNVLEEWPEPSDPVLDNLPPLQEKNGKLTLPAERISFSQAIDVFTTRFPLGFEDPAYIEAERAYKWEAHGYFTEHLGNGQFNALLTSDIEGLAHRVMQCVNKVNLLYPIELAAFKEALQDAAAAARYLEALSTLLHADRIDAATYTPYAEAVINLPARKGKVATWPVATILPYLAQPDRHLFLKPEFTKSAAARLGFDLRYESTPNWHTYSAALRLMGLCHEKLAHLKPRDFIDIQSFIYITCGGYEKAGW